MILRIKDVHIAVKDKSIGITVTKHNWLWIPLKLIKTDHYQRHPNFAAYNHDYNYTLGLLKQRVNHSMSVWIDLEVEDKWLDFEFEKGKTNREIINELNFIEIL